MTTTNNIYTKTATLDDLDEIMQVEKSFSEDPKYHASIEKMKARIQKFGQGFFLTYVDNQLAYIISTCCVHYNPKDLSNFISWDHITHNGFLADHEPPENANALYIVSGVVGASFQQYNLFGAPYPHLLALTQKLKLEYIIAGAILPGYANYIKQNGYLPAQGYAHLRNGSRLVDPLLEKYRRIHFHVPDEHHIRENYYEHPDSHSYSAIVVHKISKHAPGTQ